MKPEEVNPVAVTALAKSIDSKLAKACAGQIEEGTTQQVQLTAKIRGTVCRRDGTTVKPTAKLLNKAILAELLRRLGVTREAFQRHLLEIATEAIASGTTTAQQMEAANPELLLALRQVETEIIDQLPKEPRAGRIEVATTVDLSAIKVAA